MKKKIICLILILLIIATIFCSCYNKRSNTIYKHIHFVRIYDFNTDRCATIKNLYTELDGIKVETVEHGEIFIGRDQYQLFENKTKCPYCKGENIKWFEAIILISTITTAIPVIKNLIKWCSKIKIKIIKKEELS